MNEYLHNLGLTVAFILTLAGVLGAVGGSAYAIVDEKLRPLALTVAGAVVASLAFSYIVTFA